ncbi:MAG: 2,3-bisphosphoglycerate-dependent phosphoglycerate mutase [Candidatus Daviesbacteria bacterium]|nr:2,3-bisphosphoglycerate-dependent phosphoglycerate mutase [Candidatus Daviesbacteria bacterium]
MVKLVLVRHGQSRWNATGAWTGLTDISLDEKGMDLARKDGEVLKNISFQIAFTSELRRAQQSLDEIKNVLGNIPTIEDAAINERDYGDLTGKNKLEVEKKYGEEQYLKWRRSWDYPVPNGETLKDVYNRVVPFYQNSILPEVKKGKNVLVVAHGNSLRALIKYLENIPDEEIPNLELATGEIYIYEMSKAGVIISKEVKTVRI